MNKSRIRLFTRVDNADTNTKPLYWQLINGKLAWENAQITFKIFNICIKYV